MNTCTVHQCVVRILEIGAGTGGTASVVLPSLPEHRSEYWFTDIADVMVSHAYDKFHKQYPFVQYGILDIELDPTFQGFAASSFDAVIATNAIHSTEDIASSLSNVQQLLHPGGIFVVFESTETERTALFDTTFGLTANTWNNQERTHALQTRQQWVSWFRHAGFEMIPNGIQPSLGSQVQQHRLEAETVFVLRCPAAPHVGNLSTAPSFASNAVPYKGAFLIAGGTSGIGLVTAQWLVQTQDARSLVLAGTSEVTADLSNAQTLCTMPRTSVETVFCNITRPGHIATVLTQREICGVVCVCGSNSFPGQPSSQAISEFLSPMRQVQQLRRLTQHAAMSCFLLLSTAEQDHSHALLDSFAQRRRSMGYSSLALTWKQYDDTSTIDVQLPSCKSAPRPSVALFQALRGTTSALIGVGMPVIDLRSIYDERANASEISEASEERQLYANDKSAIQNLLRTNLADIGIIDLSSDSSLMDVGIDSMMAMELQGASPHLPLHSPVVTFPSTCISLHLPPSFFSSLHSSLSHFVSAVCYNSARQLSINNNKSECKIWQVDYLAAVDSQA